MEQPGLRERKKARTRRTISATAIALFREHGYDAVSVAQVAEAAEVSKRTLFAYFPTKDDLVLHVFADHEDEPARVVRTRADGEAPLAALRRHRREALERGDPATGISDEPGIVAFYQLVSGTPSLHSALVAYTQRTEAALAAALADAAPGVDPVITEMAAAQIVAAERVLAAANQNRVLAGASSAELLPTALDETDRAYAMLAGGLTPFAPA